MKYYTDPTTGEQIEVTVCKPSQRKAHGKIQKPRYSNSSRGGNWIATDKGQRNVD